MPDDKQQTARAEQVNAAAKEATLLTLDEAALVLGISARTLYQYARDGKIKAVKFANRWRIAAAALKDVAASTTAPTPTASDDATTAKTKKPRGKLAVLIRDFDELHALALESAARLAKHVEAIEDMHKNANMWISIQTYEKLLDEAKASKAAADRMVEICERVTALLRGRAEK